MRMLSGRIERPSPLTSRLPAALAVVLAMLVATTSAAGSPPGGQEPRTERPPVQAVRGDRAAAASLRVRRLRRLQTALPPCTIYVAPDGSSGNSGAVARSPLPLRTGASRVVPGSVVCLEPGTYTLTSPLYLARAGRPGAYVVFRSEGGKALLTSDFSRPDEIVQVQSTAAYLEFDGLSFDGKGANANSAIHIKDHSHHIRVIDNVITNMGAGGILVSNADYVTCIGNDIHRFGDGAGWASGISFNSDAGAWWYDTGTGFHNVFADNVISGGVDDSSYNSDGNGIILDLGGRISPTLITGNVVYMNGGRGIESYRTTGAAYIVNNTLYKNGLDLRQRGLGELVANAARNQIWANNIVVAWEPRYSYQLEGGSSAIELLHDGRHGGLGPAGVPSRALNDRSQLPDAEPRFVAPPAVDPGTDGQWRAAPVFSKIGVGLALRQASPFVDSGVDPRSLPHLTSGELAGIEEYAMHAIDGTPRPVGAGFDLGAYER